MDLTSNARELLRMVSQSPEPVAISDFFHVINPAPDNADESQPGYEAWAESQLKLYGDSVALWQQGLVRIVHPANGERPDLVIATDKGRTALASAGTAT